MADIKDKIRKLLAMADGEANDNESKQALSMASMLMMKHGIDEVEVRESEAKPEVIEGTHLSTKHYQKYVGFSVNKLYRVRYVHWSNHKQMAFVGRPELVEAAELTFAHITLQIEAAYKRALPKGLTKTERSHWRQDFKLAAAREVYWMCDEIIKAQSAPEIGGTALVLHESQLAEEISDYFKAQNIRSGKRRTGTGLKRMRNFEATVAGNRAGRRVEVNVKVK